MELLKTDPSENEMKISVNIQEDFEMLEDLNNDMQRRFLNHQATQESSDCFTPTNLRQEPKKKKKK